ncbi:MAG: nitroreductase family protein [Nitrososphaerota archaeon]|nr:nitroreductase family protein [Nitrososphaerota archaeon]
MNATEAVRTKLDSREFAPRPVGPEVKKAVLEAARLTQSGVNSQHWSFILVEDPRNLVKLAADSTTGSWVANANFAVVVCTDPSKGYHVLDAGRAVQDMQLTAWDSGVTSRIYTGIKQAEMRRDFGVPESLNSTVVVGFGYPKKKVLGRKNRKPLSEVAFLERYGNPLGKLAQ